MRGLSFLLILSYFIIICFTIFSFFIFMKNFNKPFLKEINKLYKAIIGLREEKPVSVFTDRTEDSSASQYFQFYGYLSQQQVSKIKWNLLLT